MAAINAVAVSADAEVAALGEVSAASTRTVAGSVAASAGLGGSFRVHVWR